MTNFWDTLKSTTNIQYQESPKLKNIKFLTKVLQCQKHKFGDFSKRSRWKKGFSAFLTSKHIVETCADFGFFSKFFQT